MSDVPVEKVLFYVCIVYLTPSVTQAVERSDY
jgi:hypothetical protein